MKTMWKKGFGVLMALALVVGTLVSVAPKTASATAPGSIYTVKVTYLGATLIRNTGIKNEWGHVAMVDGQVLQPGQSLDISNDSYRIVATSVAKGEAQVVGTAKKIGKRTAVKNRNAVYKIRVNVRGKTGVNKGKTAVWEYKFMAERN